MKTKTLTGLLAVLVLSFITLAVLFYLERQRTQQLQTRTQKAQINYEKAQTNLSNVRTNRSRVGLNRASRDSIISNFAKGIPNKR